MALSRRDIVLGSAATLTLGGASLSARAAETDSRFVLIFLRGAMDGLDVVVPYGDSNLKTWRPSLMLPDPGRVNGLEDLGDFWGLHPSLKTMHALYASNDLLPIQCVSGPDRSRSHFEAQDIMETGADKRLTGGWLSRVAALLPKNPRCDVALNVGEASPLVLHGPTLQPPGTPSLLVRTCLPGFIKTSSRCTRMIH